MRTVALSAKGAAATGAVWAVRQLPGDVVRRLRPRQPAAAALCAQGRPCVVVCDESDAMRIVTLDGKFAARLAHSKMRLACYTNAQKCAHMRHRARLRAAATRQRVYWSIAKDLLKGEGA